MNIASQVGDIFSYARTLPSLLDAAARKFPEKTIAYVDPETGLEEATPYATLRKDAHHVAAALQRRGYRPGDILIFVIDSTRMFVPMFWGCIVAGVIPAPLAAPLAAGLDTMEADKIRNVAASLSCSVVFDSREAKLAGTMRAVLGDNGDRLVFADEILADARLSPSDPDLPPIDGDTMAILQFSSGSSGEPKGVMLSHTNLLSNIGAQVRFMQVRPQDVLVTWMPYFHDFGLFWGHIAALGAGMHQVRIDHNHFARRPALWLDKLHEHGATLTNTTPTALDHLLGYLELRRQKGAGPWDLSRLRAIMIGAEMVQPRACRKLVERLSANGLKQNIFVAGYGLTETTMGATATAPEAPLKTAILDREALVQRGEIKPVDAGSPNAAEFASVGRTDEAYGLRIVDSEGWPVGLNRIGTVEISGDHVTSGYYRNSAATAEVLKDGWFNSGDLGFFDEDGDLYITGRLKEIIIVNGHNHYPYDIEQMVWKAAPETLEAFRFVGVSGFYNPATAKDEIALFIVPMRGDEEKRRALIGRVCATVNELAGFPIDHVVLIAGKDVPRTSSGKLMRRVLRDRFLKGDFDSGLVDLAHGPRATPPDAAPRDRASIEALARRVWVDTLAVSDASLQAASSFFELGGNSIKASLLHLRLEEALRFRLEPNFTYLYPSLEKQIDTLAGRDFSIEPPADEVEQIVLTVVKDALSSEGANVGATQRLTTVVPTVKELIALIGEVCRVFDLDDQDRATLAGDTVREIAAAVRRRLGIGAGRTGEPFSLMNFQETLYFHRKGFVRNEPSRLSCFIFLELMLDGEIEARRLERAFDRIIARHPMLRAVIDDSLDRPRLKILETVPPFRIQDHDISHLPPEEQRALLTRRGRDMNDIRFEIDRWPLFACDLYRLRERRFAFLFDIDHFLVDGYSFMHLMEELFLAYDEQSGVTGALSAREVAPLGFRDYVLIEQARQRTTSYRRAMDFQLGVFSDLPPKATLPFLQDPASIDPVLFETRYRMLDPEMMGSLIDLAGRHAVSLNSLLLAAYFKLVNIWANQDDLIINMPVFNREQYFPGARKVMGSFIDIFPVRIHTRADESVMAIAERVEAFTRELLSNPVSSIELSRLIASRDGAQSGSMSSLIFSNSIGVYADGNDGVRCVKASSPHFRTGAPGTFIDLVLYDFEGAYYLNWNYVRGLLDDAFMETLADQYERILGALADDYHRGDFGTPRFDTDLLVLDKHRALIADLNDSAAPTPATTVHGAVEEQARTSPDVVALTFDDAEITYREMDDAASRLANLILAHDVGPSRFVALLFDRSPDMIIAQLAAMKAGCAYVPLDPDYPKDRIAYMIDDCEARILLCQARHLHHLEDGRIGSLEAIVALDADGAESRLGDLPVLGRAQIDAQSPTMTNAVQVDDLAYMIYTSGSTGAPKGVMIRHRNIMNFLTWVRTEFAISPEDRFAFVTSYSFDMTLASNWVPLMAGAVLHILDEERTRDVETLLDFISRKRITFLNVTPSHFSLIASARAYLGGAERPLPMHAGMRIMLGGEVINSKDLNLWLDFYPDHRFINEYGPTEASVASSFFPIPVGPGGRIEMKTVPIGKPLANNTFYILDKQSRFCLPGVAGELCIGGDGVAVGYYRKPERTRAAFVPDPFRPGAMMYRTGDMARLWDDGNVEFLGRQDHQINLRGYRIEAGEIETALCGNAAVTQAVVVARPDTAGHKQLVAFYTTADGRALSAPDLRAELARQLPRHMIPAHFQWLETLPRTPSGKFDPKALPEVVIAAEADSNAVAPRTETERKLHAIWSEVLGFGQFGIDDNFWDLGGDSLKAMRLILRCREDGLERFGLREAFAHQTIAAAAAFLDGHAAQPAGAPELTRIATSETAKTRLVLVPYACGNASAFVDLARALGDEADILALEPAAPGAREVPSIADLGTALADAVCGAENDLPVVLGGYSYGGYVAYEAARRLADRGRPAAGLVMVASTPPGARGELEWVVKATAEEIIAYSRRTYGFAETQFSASELADYIRLLKLQSESMLAHAFDATAPKVGPALVLVGEGEEDREVRDGMGAWQAYLDTPSIETLPGRHMLIKTHPGELSHRLRGFLREVADRGR